MESVVAWAAETGLHIEPYGLDISPELAVLARQRRPHWADEYSTVTPASGTRHTNSISSVPASNMLRLGVKARCYSDYWMCSSRRVGALSSALNDITSEITSTAFWQKPGWGRLGKMGMICGLCCGLIRCEAGMSQKMSTISRDY